MGAPRNTDESASGDSAIKDLFGKASLSYDHCRHHQNIPEKRFADSGRSRRRRYNAGQLGVIATIARPATRQVLGL
jgi:hypothetical protein